MATARLISTTTIQAAAAADGNEPFPRVELTPWDLQLLLAGPMQKGFLPQPCKNLLSQLYPPLEDLALPCSGLLPSSHRPFSLHRLRRWHDVVLYPVQQ